MAGRKMVYRLSNIMSDGKPWSLKKLPLEFDAYKKLYVDDYKLYVRRVVDSSMSHPIFDRAGAMCIEATMWNGWFYTDEDWSEKNGLEWCNDALLYLPVRVKESSSMLFKGFYAGVATLFNEAGKYTSWYFSGIGPLYYIPFCMNSTDIEKGV